MQTDEEKTEIIEIGSSQKVRNFNMNYMVERVQLSYCSKKRMDVFCIWIQHKVDLLLTP